MRSFTCSCTRHRVPSLGILIALALTAPAGAGMPYRGPPREPAQVPPAPAVPSARRGQPFELIPADSRLILLVYRSGLLSAFGHNHVIACRCITGTLYLPRDRLDGSFDLRVAVNQLTVDDPALRAAEHSKDFPPDVRQSARQSTRHTMLGPAVLDAAEYPDVELRAGRLRPSPDGKPEDVIADVLTEVRGQSRSITVPVHYRIQADRIVVTGEFTLRQTAIGLAPFRAMAGALRVRDAMTVRFRLVARGQARTG